jgi:hypothetical protein
MGGVVYDLYLIQLRVVSCVCVCALAAMQTARGWGRVARVCAVYTGLMDRDIDVQEATCEALLAMHL